jgi:protein-S-isoprenylcysteine O-methyltransferase Ste14
LYGVAKGSTVSDGSETAEALADIQAPATMALSGTVQASWKAIVVEIFARGTATATSGYFAWNAARQVMLNPNRIALLCLLLSETLSLVFILISRVPRRRDWHLLSVLAGIYVYSYSPLLDTTPGLSIAPQSIAGGIGAFGFLLMIWAKLSLGRSFGILPAQRKLVFRGPYAFIRHPMYAGYTMISVMYLLSDYKHRNALVLGTLLICQLYRIMREERLLRLDPDYVAYCERVRFRFIPFVY